MSFTLFNNYTIGNQSFQHKTYDNSFSKPCFNVSKDAKTVVFGTCTKPICTFAHTLEEFKPRVCNYDNNCRNNICKFKHSDETNFEYIQRTKLPPLPSKETVAAAIVPQPSKEPVLPSKEPVLPSKEPVLPSKATVAIVPQPSKEPVLPSKAVEITYKSILTNDTYSDSESDTSSDSESDIYSESESEIKMTTTHQKQTKMNNSIIVPNENKSLHHPSLIVRVPNEELAKFAISAAFMRGRFDIKIVIE